MITYIVVVRYDIFFQVLSALCPTMPKCSDNPTTSANSFMLQSLAHANARTDFGFSVENVNVPDNISYVTYHVTINQTTA